MMTWKIRYTDKARRDLRNIMEYVSYDLLEPDTASHPAAFLTRWQGGSFTFLGLTKAERLDIMKTKGDTVTCSQASKSYYKIADHSSAIEWSACFCGEKEQQDRCQQENLQCFLPHLHHLPSHELRWDGWPDH